MKPYGLKTKDEVCCPGHDMFPTGVYRNRRSVRARAKGKQVLHQWARTKLRRELYREAIRVINEITTIGV